MNNFDIANGLILKGLQIKKYNTFNDRLMCQKKIYLLQELGVKLKYDYNWYIHGPYSPTLTSYMYNNLDVLNQFDYEDKQLKKEAENKINIVNEISRQCCKDLDLPSWYELIASIIYIRKNWTEEVTGSVYNTLIKYKPKFTEEQFQIADECVKGMGIN